MRQKTLTLEGMRQGVHDSNIFLIVLSQHVLGSWYCQQEMLCAIERDKEVQLLIEEEPRFFPFDVKSWNRSKSLPANEELQQEVDEIDAQIKDQRVLFDAAVAAENEGDEVAAYDKIKALQAQKQTTKSMMGNSGKRMIKAISGGMTEVPPAICKMIDDNLPDAVTYRRRDFEAASMMQELCRRNRLLLPSEPSVEVAEGEKQICVFTIFCEQTASDMAAEIVGAVSDADRIVFTSDESELATADRVLVLLTAKVLTPPTLEMLEAVIKQDNEAGRGRLTFMYREDNWSFDCKEKKEASPAVQETLNNHEALIYRRKSEGHTRHEFGTMMQHLLRKIGAEAAVIEADIAPSEEAEEDILQAQMKADPSFELSPEEAMGQKALIEENAQLKQQVEANGVALEAKDAALTAKDAEIAALKANTA